MMVTALTLRSSKATQSMPSRPINMASSHQVCFDGKSVV